MFEGELGADLGGPKREFFSRALQCLVDVDQAYKIQLFGGLVDHRVPLYNVEAISEECFNMAGRLHAGVCFMVEKVLLALHQLLLSTYQQDQSPKQHPRWP